MQSKYYQQMWVPAWSGAGASSKLQLLLRQELYNTLLGAYMQPGDICLNKTALQACERGHGGKPLHRSCLSCWLRPVSPGPQHTGAVEPTPSTLTSKNSSSSKPASFRGCSINLRTYAAAKQCTHKPVVTTLTQKLAPTALPPHMRSCKAMHTQHRACTSAW